MSKTELVVFYLKKYRFLSIAIFVFVVFGSFLEVFNVGLIFPILQGVIGSVGIFSGVPLLSRFSEIFAKWDRTDTLSVLLIFYILTFSFRHMAFYFGNVSISKQRFLITRDLQMYFFDRLMRAGMKFYDFTKSGYIMNSIYNETIRIGGFINCILRIFATATRLAVNVFILFFISWEWTLVSLAVFAVVRIPLAMIVKRMRLIGISINKAVAAFNFTVLEILSGIRVIRIFSQEEHERRKFKEVADRCYDCNYKNLKNSELLLPVSQIIFIGVFLTSFMILIRSARVDLVRLIPFLVAFLYVSKNVLADFGILHDRKAEAESYLGAFESYNKYIEAMECATEKNGTRIFTGLHKGIRFEDVHFGYSAEKQILRGLSFYIPKGEMTAIVGSSGIGKTTIVNILLRFYEISQGKIFVDDIGLSELERHSWRGRIGVVSQDVFIFNASARENIGYGRRGASIEEIRKVAGIAGIAAYLEGLPEGYDTVLGERGVRLSGGQKQRISIARAIMQNPEILILDEATSHLDSETERQIQEAIDRLAKNRTVITIAHRLSTVRRADNIVVIDKGKVVESGMHAELMAMNGAYKRFHDTQFNVFS